MGGPPRRGAGTVQARHTLVAWGPVVGFCGPIVDMRFHRTATVRGVTTDSTAQGTGPRDPECLFCRVIAEEIPADVVAQDDRVLAFRDIDPQAPVHVLVVPRAHHRDVGALALAAPDDLIALVRMGSRIAQDECGGQFRLVFNSGPVAQQTVFHVHGHVIGGRAMTWPPG